MNLDLKNNLIMALVGAILPLQDLSLRDTLRQRVKKRNLLSTYIKNSMMKVQHQ